MKGQTTVTEVGPQRDTRKRRDQKSRDTRQAEGRQSLLKNGNWWGGWGWSRGHGPARVKGWERIRQQGMRKGISRGEKGRPPKVPIKGIEDRKRPCLENKGGENGRTTAGKK